MGDRNWQGGPVLAAKIGPGGPFLAADRFFRYNAGVNEVSNQRT